MHRPAATLVEVIIVIAVLAVLLSIVIPAIAKARASAIQMKCLMNLRSISTHVQIYASEQADSVPSWIEQGVHYETMPSRWLEYGSQGSTTFEHRKWLDFAGFESTTETQYCPANTWYPEMYHTVAAPDYRISSSFYIRPAYLDPVVPPSEWYNRLGAGVQRVHAVRYPSAKVGYFEFFVWHGWKGRRCEGCPVADLEFHNADRSASIVFVDGHAQLKVASEAVHPVLRYPNWPSVIYGTTPHGVHGRDF